MGRCDRPSLAAGEPELPRSGDVLQVTREASVQFRVPIYFRVIRVHDWPTYAGWVWLDGYQLNDAGEATERRSIFVQTAGLRRVSGPTPAKNPRPGGRGGRRTAGTSPPAPPPPIAGV
ncbi:hypothetical protein [Natronosporangium hydrolyticum]|uniref:hypothetical protein n=1 Tax=Natronosporangium hydrolyticum TaxID=2811111 RepID=UPI001EFA1339|nr:hypothetical protein [Natronosporangium hydrolyticum]